MIPLSSLFVVKQKHLNIHRIQGCCTEGKDLQILEILENTHIFTKLKCFVWSGFPEGESHATRVCFHESQHLFISVRTRTIYYFPCRCSYEVCNNGKKFPFQFIYKTRCMYTWNIMRQDISGTTNNQQPNKLCCLWYIHILYDLILLCISSFSIQFFHKKG